MIGRSGKALLVLYIVCLVILFLMCSTNLIIREPEQKIYQISVIIEDMRSDNYSNFRKGIDQAAVEFNTDIHFITLYEKLDAEQQVELMEREQQDGADALIVVPVDEEQVAEKQMTIPVTLLRAGVAEAAGAGNIVIDYEKMGERLAQAVLEDIPQGGLVCMLTDPSKQSDMDSMFLKGIDAVLEKEGCRVRWIARRGEDGFRAELETIGLGEDGEVVLLAQNQEILTEAAGILADNAALSEAIKGLYGRGTTMPILNYLDRGIIKGICVADEFSIGYYSVREAVRALEGAGSVPTVMDSYYINKEDLRNPDFEKLLFPIE
ncbi:hypothetical protein D3Z45_19930 [Lachnospiraceae bacterium]|nr:hypothetical protein [Lachnospiraceae bacterium]